MRQIVSDIPIFPILPVFRKIHLIKIALDPILENRNNTQPNGKTGGLSPDLRQQGSTSLITHGGIQVKKTHWITLIVSIAIVLGIYAVPAITQTQPAAQQQAPLPYLVAVIDLAQVIKQHPDFIARQAKLAEDVKAAEVVFKQREDEILGQRKLLDSSPHKPGTPEYQQQLELIANKAADFEKDAKTYQRRFSLENSRIMYDTYKDIKAAIDRYATRMSIAQVTDYRMELEVNPLDPATVAEDMDQRLVWFNSRLNITPQVINEIKSAAAARGGMPQTATAPAPAGQLQRPLQ